MKRTIAKPCIQFFALSLIIVLIITVLPVQLFAQKKVHPALLNKNDAPSLYKVFKNYSLFRVNTAEINAFAKANGKGVSDYEFKFEGYPDLPVSIYENGLISSDYKAFAGSDNGKQLLPRTQARTYSGKILNDLNSAVYLTLSDNFISGAFQQNAKMYLIEPLRYFDKNADPSIYIMYEDVDVVPNSGAACSITEAKEHAVQEQHRQSANNTTSATASTICVETAIAADYSMVSFYGIVETEQRILAAMNLVKATFAATAFTNTINIYVVGQYLSTSVAADPFQTPNTGTDATIMLGDFRLWGEAGNFGFGYDIAQLWTAKDVGQPNTSIPGGYDYNSVGIAFIGNTCSNIGSRYSVVEGFSSDIFVACTNSTHMIGHLLGANHSAEGVMTAIIYYNPTGLPDFGFTSIAEINASVAAADCLSNCNEPLPVAVFLASSNLVCTGNSLTFTDFSGTGSRTWTFTGGNISSSTAASPTVIYPTSGLKSVKLSIVSGSGVSEITKYFMAYPAATAAAPGFSLAGDATFPLLVNFRLEGIYHYAESLLAGGLYTDNSCTERTTLLPNTTYTASFDVGFPGDALYDTKLQAFIDYNNNGDFSDTGESIYSAATCYGQTTGNSGQFSFTTPSSLLTDRFLRLRIIATPCALPGTGGNNVYDNAQVEDYAVYFACASSYTITAAAGTGGSVMPGTGSVSCGSNATYTITPNVCYNIADVLVDGVSVGAVGTYTFTNVTANHTVSATFVLNTYTITVTAGSNGTITPATASINCGTNATYTITPNACYSIEDVIVDGVSQGAVGTYAFTNVTANHTISASFVLNTYTITVTPGSNGTITPATASINCGTNATYTVTPNACYSIEDVVVDGVSQGSAGTYTFTNVTANHTISGTFSLDAYTITVTAGANGSIIPATGSVNCSDNITYTITPDACYAIADVVVDGISQGAVGTYTFTNVTANHTISATFVLNTYTITVTAGTNGSITPGTGMVNCGSNATYTITADAGYTIADVIADGSSVGAVGNYTFTNVTANHTITATFVFVNSASFTITSVADVNGSVSPNGATVVNSGANQSYSITPAACYHVQDVLVDSVSVGAVTAYTFTNITANHTISASFAINAALTVSVSGPVNVCAYIGSGNQVVYTATSTGATGFTWVTPPNVNIISGAGTSTLTVTFQNGFLLQANKQLKVTALSACGNSSQFIYYLAAQAPGTSQPIVAGSNNVCAVIGTAGTITYTITSVPGAASYNWSAPANTTITHPNGSGIANDTTVTLSFSNLFTGGNISVSASSSGCGSGGTRSLAITRSNPFTPGLIGGPTNACAYMSPAGIAATYSITPVSNISSYNWTVPAGATGFTGQGTNSISFIYPAGLTGGVISVIAVNGCGISATRSLTITKLNPATPGPADIVQVEACPDRTFTYTLASMPANSTFLQWTIPAAATLVSGQGTNSIIVSYPSAAVSGNVTVQAQSNCANSATRIIAVKLPACPTGNPLKPTAGTSISKFNATLMPAADQMQLNVFPNPSADIFNLQVKSIGQQPIYVRVLDLSGRQLEKFNIMTYASIQIARHLKAGMYILEVRKGSELKTMKLVKQ